MSSTENENTTPTLDADALRDVLGDEVDARLEARGLTDDRIAKLDLLDSIEGVFDGLFEKHKTTPNEFDKEGLMKDLSTLIDSKLAGLTSGGGGNGGGSTVAGKRVGPLGRYLFGSGS